MIYSVCIDTQRVVCVYSGPAMLLRLIEYQDWKKIGMADMLYSILPRLCGLIRQNMRVYAHKIPLFRNKIPFVIGSMIIN